MYWDRETNYKHCFKHTDVKTKEMERHHRFKKNHAVMDGQMQSGSCELYSQFKIQTLMDGKQQDTKYWCDDCNVGSCLVPCFHTSQTEANL